MESTTHWAAHAKQVCEQLNEKERRWVAGLLSEIIGWGGTKQVEATGLDPKTIRQGRLDLEKSPMDALPSRVRHQGAGRPPLKKSAHD